MSAVETLFRHCPACGRRFEIRLVGKKKVGETSEYTKTDIPRFPSIMSGARSWAAVTVDEDVPVEVDVETFQYVYKCKHCGHQWAELHQTDPKDIETPRDYSGD